VVLITGGGSGIGKTTALLMATEGAAAVIVAGRRQEPIDAVAAEVTELGAQGLALQCDVGDQASVQAMFTTIQETFGRLDVLFNNAGYVG
jgi:NAD(P)-dependent dehydrogenase (short-subunit alcohol dehydrogenase family)